MQSYSRIIVTGHSQGGALATIGALDLQGVFPCNAHKIKVLLI